MVLGKFFLPLEMLMALFFDRNNRSLCTAYQMISMTADHNIGLDFVVSEGGDKVHISCFALCKRVHTAHTNPASIEVYIVECTEVHIAEPMRIDMLDCNCKPRLASVTALEC